MSRIPGLPQVSDDRRGLVFVLSPMGSQWPGMGRELMAREPVFRGVLEECDEAILREGGWSLLDELAAEPSASGFGKMEIAEPAICCVQMALGALLRSWGVVPDVVVGHSLGEVAAANIAGVLDVATTARMICIYSRAQTDPVCDGRIVLVGLSAAETETEIRESDEADLVVAGMNGAHATLVSGAPPPVARFLEFCQGRGRFAAPIGISVAAHSPHFDGVAEQLPRLLDWLQPAPASVCWLSSVTGGVVEGTECDGTYWARNTRDKVLFGPLIEGVLTAGFRDFLEISPHPILVRSIKADAERFGDGSELILQTMRRNDGAATALMNSLRSLRDRGYAMSVPSLDDDTARAAVGTASGALPDGLADAGAAGDGDPTELILAGEEDGPTLEEIRRAASADERSSLVGARIQTELRRVLGLSLDDDIPRDVGLFAMGLDSVRSAALSARLQNAFQVPLPTTVTFNYSTVAALAEHIVSLMRGGDGKAGPTVASRRYPELDALRRDIDDLDDTDTRAALRQKLDAVERARTEPIAIIGMGCRFPGSVDEPGAYWELLRNGVDAIGEIPTDRWDISQYFDPDPGAPGMTYSKWGGFVDQVDTFDAPFFGITPREARRIDPQQRLFLEVAWESLENAGVAGQRLKGSRTGVFAGFTMADYWQLHTQRLARDEIDAYIVPGNIHSLAGRLSYFLGSHGPSISVDTACSSSLVALHLACRSLRERESDLALAGGTNLNIIPETFVCFSKGGLLSATGRCKTFDASADGFVRGEGCGVAVLKRLSDAIADGDRILAVVRGTAVNQDGRSSGPSVPNGLAQSAAIREALADAGVGPGAITYVEAHGTGTSLGDPIEMEAIGEVYSEGRSSEEPLLVGSAKTNVGHLEAASGMAGLFKAVLALQHGEIPPNLHFSRPNPLIHWDDLPVRVPVEPTAWESTKGPRMAGVSSFGISGTNAHVILEEAPSLPAVDTAAAERSHLLPISAKTEAALEGLAVRYRGWLRASDKASIEDVCFTAAAGRSHFDRRLAVVGGTAAELADRLDVFLSGSTAAGICVGEVVADEAPGVAFLFTGQGSQYPGMGKGLYETSPTFRAAMDRCDELLAPLLGRSILSVLFESGEDRTLLDQTGFTQPLLFAVEYALAQVWREWGVQPTVVAGHSVGEYVAACVAGVFSLEDGLRLIAARGRLMQSLPAGGAMAALMTDEGRVARAVAPFEETVSIAAVNGPGNIVISGAAADVDRIVKELAEDGVENRPLSVSHAFHSPLMDPILDEFAEVAAQVAFAEPRLPLISNVTGRHVEAGQVTDPAYWRDHIRSAVRFADAIGASRQTGVRHYLEVGPHPVLIGMGRFCLPDFDGGWLPSLRRGADDREQLLESLGNLYVSGANIDAAAVAGAPARARAVLPTYAFQRERYWLEEAPTDRQGAAVRLGDPESTMLLGDKVNSPLATCQFSSVLSTEQPAFLRDHTVRGQCLFPAAGFLELAQLAGREVLGTGQIEVRAVELSGALVVDSHSPRVLHTVVEPDPSGTAEFSVYSAAVDDPDTWALHASGTVAPRAPDDEAAPPAALDATRDRCGDELDVDTFYATLRSWGLELGKSFRGIKQLALGDGEALGVIDLDADADPQIGRYGFHPGLLDSCLQVSAAIIESSGEVAPEGGVLMPVGLTAYGAVSEAAVRGPIFSHVRVTADDAGYVADIDILDERGDRLARVEGYRIRWFHWEVLYRSWGIELPEAFYAQAWVADEGSAEGGGEASVESAAAVGSWLLLADDTGLADNIAAALRESGDACVTARVGDRRSDEEASATVHPLTPDDFTRLVEAAVADGTALRGVVFLWPIDARLPRDAGLDAIEEVQQRLVGGLLHLAQALTADGLGSGPPLWIVTDRGQHVAASDDACPGQAMAWGFGHTLALEHPELDCRRVDLDLSCGDAAESLLRELRSPDREDRIAYREGLRHVCRLEPLRIAAVDAGAETAAGRTLVCATRGVFESLRFDDSERRAPAAGEIEIEIRATGLNFRDVLEVLGMYPGGPVPLGVECSGVVSRVGSGVSAFEIGDQVFAVATGSFSTHAVTDARLVVHRPDELSAEDAAGIPSAFLTAHFSLVSAGRIEAGDRVLIHAAAGGVGMSAVQIALRAGARVYATAGSTEKRDFVRALGVEQVMDSRALDWPDQVMQATDGEGVDIVLNSIAGEAITRGLEVLAPGGRFVEIGRRDLWTPEQVADLRDDVSYHIIDLAADCRERPESVAPALSELARSFATGELEPLPRSDFAASAVDEAFRTMAHAKHIGKIVVTMPDDDNRAAVAATAESMRILDDATYLITGGLGGLGLLTAHWLGEQGARSVVLMGRSGPSAAARTAIEELEQTGMSVVVASCDLTDASALEASLHDALGDLPPLRGIIHAAGVLDDGVLRQQDLERVQRVLAPKVTGTWNLRDKTAATPLDFFIMYSSAASVLGSPGQTAYSAASAFQDAMAYRLGSDGTPALSINWGPWAEAGMATRGTVARHLEGRGLRGISSERALDALGRLLRHDRTQVMVLDADWDRYARTFADGVLPPFFAHVAAAEAATGEPAHAATADDLASRLSAAPAGDRPDVVRDHVREQVARVLGMSGGFSADDNAGLGDLGIDSLMSVELRNRLQASTDLSLPSTLAFDYPTVTALADFLSDRLLEPAEVGEELHATTGGGNGATAAAPATERDEPAEEEDIAVLSDEEAEALLLEELGLAGDREAAGR